MRQVETLNHLSGGSGVEGSSQDEPVNRLHLQFWKNDEHLLTIPVETPITISLT